MQAVLSTPWQTRAEPLAEAQIPYLISPRLEHSTACGVCQLRDGANPTGRAALEL